MSNGKWKQFWLLLCLALTITLTGCGGGGGDTPAPAPTPTPLIKGFWIGSQGASATQAIFLANGDAWLVFLESGVATSFAHLQATTNGTSFSSSGIRYLLQTDTTETATVSGTFTEKVTLNGSMITASGASSLNLAYSTQYDIAAAMTDAVGTWTGSYRGGVNTMTVAVGDTGTLSGTSTTGCSYTGTLQLRTADPAVFDLSLIETCSDSTMSMTGIATVNAAKSAISFAATTADKIKGALFTGLKM